MINIYAFADEAHPSLDRQIEAMKRNRLQGLEMRTVNGINVSSLTVAQAKEAAEKLSDAGLVTWSVGSPIGKTEIMKDSFSDETERLRHTIEIADALSCRRIRMFSFYLPDGAVKEEYKEEVIGRLGVWAEIAEDAGILLCLENEKELYGDTAYRVRTILEAVPSIRGVFDPANLVQIGQDTLAAWEVLKDFTEYLHIKDALPDGSVVPPGCGEGHVKEIVSSYIAMGGRNVTMEPHLHGFDAYKSLEKEGTAVELGKKYVFRDGDEAMDEAVRRFRELIGAE